VILKQFFLPCLSHASYIVGAKLPAPLSTRLLKNTCGTGFSLFLQETSKAESAA
jgi:hypothetical protein